MNFDIIYAASLLDWILFLIKLKTPFNYKCYLLLFSPCAYIRTLLLFPHYFEHSNFYTKIIQNFINQLPENKLQPVHEIYNK